MRKYFFFFPALLLAVLFTDCYKEPQTIVEKVIETDTLYIGIHDTLTLNNFADTVTTLIVVRHAETTGVGSNPPLSAAGQERAMELVRILKDVPIKGVYTTNYARTMQTAQPSATDKGLTLQLYDPLEPSSFADNVLAAHHGEVVLVIGHSNTVSTLLNMLTGSNTYSTIPDSEYDNLYVVTVLAKGKAQVVHMKYGQ